MVSLCLTTRLRLQRWLRIYLFDGAATPPSKGEELPYSSENLFGSLQPFYGFFVFVLSIVEDKSRRPDGRNIDYGCLAPARPEET